MTATRDPTALVAELNEIFSAFDRMVEMLGCERIKTFGDAYLAVSGVPEANADHAAEIARVALRMRRYIERRNASHPTPWFCRIGLHTGTVIGSIVGVQKYVYDIFGPAVDIAARMRTAGGAHADRRVRGNRGVAAGRLRLPAARAGRDRGLRDQGAVDAG